MQLVQKLSDECEGNDERYNKQERRKARKAFTPLTLPSYALLKPPRYPSRPSSLLLAYHAYINHSDPKNSQESRWRTDLQLTDHPNVLVRLGDYASIKRLEQNQTFRDPTPCNIQWGITYSSLIRPFLSSWRRATLPALLLAPSLRPS